MIQNMKDTKGNAIEILSSEFPKHLVPLPLSNLFCQFLAYSPRENSLHIQSNEIIYFIKPRMPLVATCTIIMLYKYILLYIII